MDLTEENMISFEHCKIPSCAPTSTVRPINKHTHTHTQTTTISLVHAHHGLIMTILSVFKSSDTEINVENEPNSGQVVSLALQFMLPRKCCFTFTDSKITNTMHILIIIIQTIIMFVRLSQVVLGSIGEKNQALPLSHTQV